MMWWEIASTFNDWFMHDIGPGPKMLQPRVAINIHKLGAGPFLMYILFTTELSAADSQGRHGALLAALHATYGFLWCIKDTAYPDKSWQKPSTVGSVIGLVAGLTGLYYSAGYIAIRGKGEAVSDLGVMVAVACYALGVFLHFGADIQKYSTLALKKGLITAGVFKYTRNPNYLGEVLIYVCFCILSGHWLPWVCCSSIWVWMFIPNMYKKDKRMSRHAGWKAYTDQSWLLFPKPSMAMLNDALSPILPNIAAQK